MADPNNEYLAVRSRLRELVDEVGLSRAEHKLFDEALIDLDAVVEDMVPEQLGRFVPPMDGVDTSSLVRYVASHAGTVTITVAELQRLVDAVAATEIIVDAQTPTPSVAWQQLINAHHLLDQAIAAGDPFAIELAGACLRAAQEYGADRARRAIAGRSERSSGPDLGHPGRAADDEVAAAATVRDPESAMAEFSASAMAPRTTVG